jgi:aspartyl-tRNA(Asn)/glutamyl-tRNA(Gln) amidotransferase subunit C
MSKIGIDEVKRLAMLAKIGLTDEEASSLSAELGQIVEFVEQLQKVDVEGVEPTDQVTGLVDVFRPDEVKPSMSREELLKNAPDQQDGYIKVKRVLG